MADETPTEEPKLPKTKDVVKYAGGTGAILAAVMLVNSARETFDDKMTAMKTSVDTAVTAMGAEIGGLRTDVQSMAVQVAKVTTSLDTVSPSAVRAEVVKLKDTIGPRIDLNDERMNGLEKRIERLESILERCP